ncbi:MAG: 50S ribosomal protein L10 [Desulfobacteraceae bacterium]|nr:MAG: 50S ribosomal protein L10 [Desulfobacteraceae bacterium]
MLNISQKKELVERLHQQLTEVEIAIVVDYKGLDVETMTKLRAELRQSEIQIEVVKNTLLKRASENTDAQCLNDFLTGPNALVISTTDPVAPAKILVNFAKDNEKLEIKAGSLNGKLLNEEEIKQLAKMPSKDELIGKFVCTINEVPTSFVRVLSLVPGSLVNVLNAIKDQKEAA